MKRKWAKYGLDYAACTCFLIISNSRACIEFRMHITATLYVLSVPALANVGPDCFPFGGPLRVIVQSKKKVLTFWHINYIMLYYIGGTRWRSWFRHCATSRKVAGSIPDVIGIFPWHNRFGRTMALGSTQPLTAMSTRNFSWGVKAAGA
jgi:hypothetical protein